MLNVRKLSFLVWFGLGATLMIPVGLSAQTTYRDRVDYLIDTLLFASDDDAREDAAEDLGRIGDPRAVTALERAAAYDDDHGVRHEARKALKRIHGTPAVVVQQASAVVAAPAPATQPAQVVVSTPPPAVVTVTPPPPVVVTAPTPVVVAPAPVWVAPAPVVVPTDYYPAPVYGPRYGGFFSFGYYHGSRHCRR